MGFKARYISYKQTGAFSKIVTDYLDGLPALSSFYKHSANLDGIKASIAARTAFPTNRKLLVDQLKKQYASIKTSQKVNENIDKLLSKDSFTVCTAHQPNIFTGHLYFIYKILHAIKLCDELKDAMPSNNFVPVYYMGTEDADLEELGTVNINGKKYNWQTDQKGAVGRMKIDKAFMEIIAGIEGQLSVEKYGIEILSLVKSTYTIGKSIEQATFEIVNKLFNEYGLIVLLPDSPAFKKEFVQINKKELEEQFSQKLVTETIDKFPPEYKVQAAGRDINLFYLEADTRERIELNKDGYAVANTAIKFSKDELFNLLEAHPEYFSPNVILRPVFQESILPNIAFIGGGGELAYWLELQKVFDAVSVPFPVLILRNSFSIINQKFSERLKALELDAEDLFKPTNVLMEEIVQKHSKVALHLNGEMKTLSDLYEQIKTTAAAVDNSLGQHVEALKINAFKRIAILEKKMLRAEKKKFDAEQRQLNKIKDAMFPSGSLQERVDNLLPYYSVYGKQFIEMLYEFSGGLRQTFCIVEDKG